MKCFILLLARDAFVNCGTMTVTMKVKTMEARQPEKENPSVKEGQTKEIPAAPKEIVQDMRFELTPVQIAAASGHTELLKLLYAAFAEISEDDIKFAFNSNTRFFMKTVGKSDLDLLLMAAGLNAKLLWASSKGSSMEVCSTLGQMLKYMQLYNEMQKLVQTTSENKLNKKDTVASPDAKLTSLPTFLNYTHLINVNFRDNKGMSALHLAGITFCNLFSSFSEKRSR